ncbi:MULTISPECIES: acyltransferase family protein [Francisella]|uniref:acyltransferase family protein n=1 Tax=Francisella TaxID=262 RepID=UPI0011B657AB|nr:MULTISPECIES: acyltransferase family protein [Francisella]
MKNNIYYKHIDGLRAVAVLSVVFFHLDINLVKSGFLGVDIFFVISGFLITSIIIRDLENKSFSLKNFYLRRMRRILPALITVLIFSTIFAWLILLPQDLKNYSKSLVSALGSFSNLYFFKTLSFGYFSTDATVIPLLHTWSLGIEEQFYIFWPLFLIFAFNVYIGIGWKDKQALSNFDKYLIISLILIVLSLFCFRYFSYFEIYDYFNHERFYYFPLTRAFELLFGCALAIYLTRYKPTNNKLILELLSIISILLMLYPILFKDVSYPSNWTVIACVGAVLYIYAGCNERYNTLVNRFLSIKPIVFIGLVSYSLYLWHWPIIAYLNYLSIEKTHLIKLIILALSVVLATLTYLFVEKPFRYKFKTSFKKTLILLFIFPVAISVVLFYIASRHNTYVMINGMDYNKDKMFDRLYGFEYFIDNDCFSYRETQASKIPSSNSCSIGDKHKKNTDFMFVGDSTTRNFIYSMDRWAQAVNLRGIYMGQASTPFLVASPVGTVLNRAKVIQKAISKYKPRYIFMVTASALSDSQEMRDDVRKTVKYLVDNDIIPVFVISTPMLFESPKKLYVDGVNRVSIDMTSVKYKIHDDTSYINDLRADFPSIKVLDITNFFCDITTCLYKLKNVPIYADQTHLNIFGSRLLGEMYLNKYGNPLASIIE